MNWFIFRQNNSGGQWKPPAFCLNVQAPNLYEARGVAFRHGVYFNGIADGRDCACCGDRWSNYNPESEAPTHEAMASGGPFGKWYQDSSDASGVPLYLDVPWEEPNEA